MIRKLPAAQKGSICTRLIDLALVGSPQQAFFFLNYEKWLNLGNDINDDCFCAFC